MNLRYDDDEIDFRARARQWLAANVPASPRPHDGTEAQRFDRNWQRKLHDDGWAGLNWPKEFGGLGLSDLKQVIWYEELAKAKAPHHINLTYVGLMHAGPTLIARGTPEQKRYHLPRILTGESLWCQGFSEPNAGSDLASLKTRAEIDGEYIVVNGSKIWTTGAQHADFQELLVRTEPGSHRHKGLTWLICDMRTPGIEIRPIRTMLGDDHVSMVFYNDVRIPRTNVVGEINDGWKVAMSTLSFERGIGFIGDQLRLTGLVERAIELARRTRLESGRLAIEDDGVRRRLAEIKAETMAIRAMTLAQLSETASTGVPGPKGSLLKLMVTSTHKSLCELVGEFLGWTFLEYDGTRENHPWTYDYLWSWVFTISGGTSEIQREITADRLLGLPRAR
jgi:alkylation response protein AidB-like acyl-CoA dehydrogenase